MNDLGESPAMSLIFDRVYDKIREIGGPRSNIAENAVRSVYGRWAPKGFYARLEPLWMLTLLGSEVEQQIASEAHSSQDAQNAVAILDAALKKAYPDLVSQP